jgi:hypothetical protein
MLLVLTEHYFAISLVSNVKLLESLAEMGNTAIRLIGKFKVQMIVGLPLLRGHYKCSFLLKVKEGEDFDHLGEIRLRPVPSLGAAR